FQFALLAILLALVDHLPHTTGATVLGSVVLTGLVLAILAKPNVAIVGPVMAVHLWQAHGSRFLAIAAVPATLSGAAAVLPRAAAVVATCVYFQSWTIWSEWYGGVHGRNPYALAEIPAIVGNYSTSNLLARWTDADVWTVVAVLAALLGASLIAMIGVTTERRP